MRLVCPADLSRSIPIRIGKEDSETGARFGGAPPVGICPSTVGPTTRYLATVPLSMEPPLEASIFLSFSLEEMLDAAGRLGTGPSLVQAVAHPPTPRGSDGLRSEFSPHALVLGEPREDWTMNDHGRVTRSSHKVGGRPFFMHGEPALEQDVERRIAQGYVQVLQLDFPGSDDAMVEGDWPFADGVFHLLGREPFLADDWTWFWEC